MKKMFWLVFDFLWKGNSFVIFNIYILKIFFIHAGIFRVLGINNIFLKNYSITLLTWWWRDNCIGSIVEANHIYDVSTDLTRKKKKHYLLRFFKKHNFVVRYYCKYPKTLTRASKLYDRTWGHIRGNLSFQVETFFFPHVYMFFLLFWFLCFKCVFSKKIYMYEHIKICLHTLSSPNIWV